MRIFINIDAVKDPAKPEKQAIRVRTGYTFNSDDQVRIMNCGKEIYDLIKDGFGRGFQGGIIIHEGQRK